MAFNKAQMSKDLRKALDFNDFYSRLAPTTHGGPHMYHVTVSGSPTAPVKVWVETSRFTIWDREDSYNETHIPELDKVIEHLKSLKWNV